MDTYDAISLYDQVSTILERLKFLEKDLEYSAMDEGLVAAELSSARKSVIKAIDDLQPALIPLYAARTKLYVNERQITE